MAASSLPRKNVSVIGIGRLGLCFALVLENKGYNVVGVDLNTPYVKKINSKTLKSNEPRVEELLAASRNLRATESLAEGANHSDALFILVDTPSTGGERHYDHSKLGSVLSALNALKVKNKHIVIGCTVLPGYIAKVGRFLIQDCENCSLSYNPEFIAQGDIVNGQLRPDMVLIGEGSKAAGDRMQQIYEDMCENKPKICRMSPESAEITKLGVNCFITMKVTFSNLIGDIADRTPGADKFAITNAIGQDSRVGTKYLRPGYGFGGPCFPRDNRALGGYSEMVDIDPLLFKATDAYNKYHTAVQLKDKLAEPTESFTFTGVAYKPNTKVPIIEESQRLAIAKGLAEAGRRVLIRDYADTINEVKKEYGGLFQYEVLRDDQSNAPEAEVPRSIALAKPRLETKSESKLPAAAAPPAASSSYVAPSAPVSAASSSISATTTPITVGSLMASSASSAPTATPAATTATTAASTEDGQPRRASRAKAPAGAPASGSSATVAGAAGSTSAGQPAADDQGGCIIS